jgi:cob(I)alamin adenosyltransferase
MQIAAYTDILNGKRLPKDHPILECLGTIDELTVFLGDAKVALGDESAAGIINAIQKDLIVMMGVIAGMPVPAEGMNEGRLNNIIEELESKLPSCSSAAESAGFAKSTGFAVPGANPVSAKLHIARAVCRRAERRLISLDLDEKTQAALLPYINRLSYLLFLMAQAHN